MAPTIAAGGYREATTAPERLATMPPASPNPASALRPRSPPLFHNNNYRRPDPSMPRHRLLALLLLAAFGLAGCTQYNKGAVYLYDRDNNRGKYKFHSELVTEDGTKIRFTVFQPGMPATARRPLIIHAHGFALTRMKGRVGMYGSLLLTGKAAIEAWDAGYYVISIDQRGHGASGGKIGLIDPDKEAKDISAVIDWADKHLYISRKNGDPRVGMIGESYGGAVQLMASVKDPRIDAIVPVTTWYDLNDALLPNGVAKSDWAMFLGGVGYLFNPFHMDNAMAGQMAREVLFDAPQPALREKLARNSLASHCSGEEMPHADALIIHGFRDTVFPLNQGLAMRECFQRAGKDVRLIAIEHGHLAPTAQLSPGLPVWYAPDAVTCGDRTLDFRDIVVAWFDTKLRDKNRSHMVPALCLTGDKAVDEDGLPPLVAFDIPATAIGTGSSGLFEWIARPLQAGGNVLVADATPDDWWTLRKDGGLRPGRVPLLRANSPLWIAGAPTVSLDITATDRDDAVVFLRLAAWQPGKGSYRVLSQQVTPVRGPGHHEIALAAVRTQLQPGELVGLLVQGYSNQFRLTGSGFGTDATVSGRISLPIARGSDWHDVAQAKVALEEKRKREAEERARVEAAAIAKAAADPRAAEATASGTADTSDQEPAGAAPAVSTEPAAVPAEAAPAEAPAAAGSSNGAVPADAPPAE
jgi:ABC-2 type transport system ATP-binding protein